MSLVASQVHGHQSTVLVHGGGKGLAVHLQLGLLKSRRDADALGQLVGDGQLGVVGQGDRHLRLRGGGGGGTGGVVGGRGIPAGVASRAPRSPVDVDGVGLFAAVLGGDLDGHGVVAHAQPGVTPHRHLGLSIGGLGGHRHAGGGVGHRGAVAGGASGEAGRQGAGADGQGAEVVVPRSSVGGIDGDRRPAGGHIQEIAIAVHNRVFIVINRCLSNLQSLKGHGKAQISAPHIFLVHHDDISITTAIAQVARHILQILWIECHLDRTDSHLA